MRYVLKALLWVIILILPFLIVQACVWLGDIFGFSEIVSSAAAVGLMLAGTTYELGSADSNNRHCIQLHPAGCKSWPELGCGGHPHNRDSCLSDRWDLYLIAGHLQWRR